MAGSPAAFIVSAGMSLCMAGMTATVCGASAGFGSSFFSATMGNAIVTALPFAAACSDAGCARRTVTRVRRLPISVTSSALMAMMVAGRFVGITSEVALVVPVRSITN